MDKTFESKAEEKFAQSLLDNIQIETTLNRGDDLPFAYYNPETDGAVSWMCGYDAQGKITSVFVFKTAEEEDKNCSYLNSKEEALSMRQELINNGWQKTIPPEIQFSYKDKTSKGSVSKPLNRKQKRELNRRIENMKKHNPLL